LRTFAAISFLFILLFNLCGYKLVIHYLQQGTDRQLVQQLDRENYNEADLIAVKTPITLPYYANSPTYERVDGTIEVAGIEYNYVKRRIFNDSLELLCLPNTAKQQLKAAEKDYDGLAHGWTASESAKKAANVFKTLLTEYCENYTSFTLPAANAASVQHPLAPRCHLPAAHLFKQEQPPEPWPFTS
jgi:hypothetical protein